MAFLLTNQQMWVWLVLLQVRYSKLIHFVADSQVSVRVLSKKKGNTKKCMETIKLATIGKVVTKRTEKNGRKTQHYEKLNF